MFGSSFDSRSVFVRPLTLRAGDGEGLHRAGANMKIWKSAIAAAVCAAAIVWGAPAKAADAAHAWGTVSNPGGALLNSAQAHEDGGVSAQIVSQGPPAAGTIAGGFPAVTSCGTCTTITIQGNQNSISGTSITSSNTGVVTSNGFFNE